MIVKIFCDPNCRFDFNFYHGLAKRAVDRLKGKNQNRASVWLEALEKAQDNDVRVIYVKLLIIQCITNKLLPPFNEDPIPGNEYEYYRPNETCLDMVYQYYKTLERMRELPKQIDFEKVDDRSTDYLTFVTKHLMPIPGYHFVYGCSKDTIHTWQYSSLPPILDESSDEEVGNSWLFQGESRTTMMELKDTDLFPISLRIRPLWGSNLSPVISKDETPVDQPTDVSLPYLTPPINNYYDYMRSVGLRRLPFRPKLPRDSFEKSQKEYSKTDLSPIRERDIFYQVSLDEFSADFEDTMDLDGEVVSYSDFIKSDTDIDLDKTPPRVDPAKFLQGEFSPVITPFMSTPIKPKKAPILHSSLELRKKKRPLVAGVPYMVPETRVQKTKLPYIYELERFIESPEKVPPRLPIQDIDLDLSELMVFKKQSSADMLDYVDDSDVLLTESAAFDDIAKFLQEEKLKSPPRIPVADKQDIESMSPKSSETEYFTSKDYLQTESQASTSKSSLAESEYYSGEEQMQPVEPVASVVSVAPVASVASVAPVVPVGPVAPVAPLPPRVKRRVRFNTPEASKEDSFIEENKRDYKWMADLSFGPGLPTDEEQASDLWESFGWWTDDPDEIFQYFPPSPRAGRSLAEIYNIPDRWYEAPPTPPIFSKYPRIREGIGAKRIYAIEEFGMEWFEEPLWTDAEMFFRRKHHASPYTNPRDIDRRTLDMTQFPPLRSPKQIFEIEELFKAEDFIDSEVTPHLHEISFEDTDFKEMTRSEAIIEALRQGPMPSPKSEVESESIIDDEKIKDSAIEIEKEEEDGELMDMEFLDKTPPSFIKYHKTPPLYTINTDIDFDESISKYLIEDLKIIHGDKPQSPKEKTPRQIRPKRLSFESPELVSDKYDVIPSPEWKTPKRHIIPPQKDIDWITELPSSVKVAKVTDAAVVGETKSDKTDDLNIETTVKVTKFKKRKPIILYPGMTQEAVDAEIEMMKDMSRQNKSFIRGRQIIRELRKTFSTPPPAPASPEPEPHIFDEPIPTDLPRALAPPSGWNWKTPEAMKKGEYKKPVIKTPTWVKPGRQEPTGFSEDVGLYFESPPREALSPTSAIGALMFSPDKSFEEYIEGKTKVETRSPIRSPGGRELQWARDEIDYVQIYPDQFDLMDEEGEPELYKSPEKEEIPDYLQKIREQEIELGLRPRSPKTFKELQEEEIRMLEKEIFESTEPSQFEKPTEPEVLNIDSPESPESPEYKRRAWRQELELYKPRKYDKGQYIRYMTERRTRSGKIKEIKPYEVMDVIQEEPFNEPVVLFWQGTPARKPVIKEIRSPIMAPDHLKPSIYRNEPTSPDVEYINFGLPSPRRHEYIPPQPYIESPIETPVTPQKRRVLKKPRKLEFEPELPDEDVIPTVSPKSKRERKPRRINFDEPQFSPPPAIPPENWTWRTPKRFTKDDIYADHTITENLMLESPPPELYSPGSSKSPIARPAFSGVTDDERSMKSLLTESPPSEFYSEYAHAERSMEFLLTESPPFELYSEDTHGERSMKSLVTESPSSELYSSDSRISHEAVSSSAERKTPKKSLLIESPPPGLYSPEREKSSLEDSAVSATYESKVDEVSKETDLLEGVTFDFAWEISYSSLPISGIPKQASESNQKDILDIETTSSFEDISETSSIIQDISKQSPDMVPDVPVSSSVPKGTKAPKTKQKKRAVGSTTGLWERFKSKFRTKKMKKKSIIPDRPILSPIKEVASPTAVTPEQKDALPAKSSSKRKTKTSLFKRKAKPSTSSSPPKDKSKELSPEQKPLPSILKTSSRRTSTEISKQKIPEKTASEPKTPMKYATAEILREHEKLDEERRETDKSINTRPLLTEANSSSSAQHPMYYETLRHVIRETKSDKMDDLNIGTPVKVTKPKKRKPIILYPGMTQEAVDAEIEMMKDMSRQNKSFIRGRQIIRELKKTFSTPPPAPASPEPEPHIFDEPIPTDLPRALAPPSGWNWKTPEAMKKGEYKKPVIKTPTWIKPGRQEPTGFSEDVGLYFESPPREALSPTSAIGALMFSPDKSFEEYIEGKTKVETRSPLRSPGGRELQWARDEIDYVQIYPDQFDLMDEEGEPELYKSPEKEEIPDYLQKIREQEIELGLRPRSPKTFKELQEEEIRMLEKEIFESTEPSQFEKPTEPEVLNIDSPESPEYKRRAWRQELELYEPRKYDMGQYIRYMTERRTRSGKIKKIKPYVVMDVIQEDPFNEPIRILWERTPPRKPEIKDTRTPVITPGHLKPSIYPNEPTTPDAEYIDFGLPSPERHEYLLPKSDLKTPVEVTPQKRRILKKPKKLEFEPESSLSEDESRIVILPISPKRKRERKPRRIDFDEPVQYTPGPVSIPENWEWRTPRRFTKDDIYSDKTVTENIMSESPPLDLYSPKSEESPTAGRAVSPAAFAGTSIKSLLQKSPIAGTLMKSLFTESPPIDLYSPKLKQSPKQRKSPETKESPPRGLYIPKLWELPLAEPETKESPPEGLYIPKLWDSPLADPTALISYPPKSSAVRIKSSYSKRDIIDYYSNKKKPMDILEEETIDFFEITDTPLISISSPAALFSPKTSSKRSPAAAELLSRKISPEIRQEQIESDSSTSYASFALPSTRRALKRKYPRSDANLTPIGMIHMTTPEDRQKAIKSDIEISSSDDESLATVRKKSKSDITQKTRIMLPRKKLDFDKLPSSSEEDEEEVVVQEYSSKTSRKYSPLPLQDQTDTESVLIEDENVTTQTQTATPTTRYARRRSSRIVSKRSPAALYPTQKTPTELLKSTPITEMISTSPRVSPRQPIETIYATPTYDQTPERLPPKPQPGVVYVPEMTPSPSMMFESDVVYTIEDVTSVTPLRERVSPIQESDAVHAIKETTPSARDSPVYALPETAVRVTPRRENEAVYITPTARVSPVRKRRVTFALSAVSATPRRKSEAVKETALITSDSSVPKRRIKFDKPETSPEVLASPIQLETIYNVRKDTVISPKAPPKRLPPAEYIMQETAPPLVQISPTSYPTVSPRQSPRIAYGTQEIGATSSPTRHPIFIKPVNYQIRPSISIDTDINIGTPTKYVKPQEVDETNEYVTGTYDTEKRRQELLEDIQSQYGMSPERQPMPSPEHETHMLDESVPKGLPNPLLGPTDWQWSTPVQFHKVPYKKPVLRTPGRISPVKPEPVGFDSDVSLYFESPPYDMNSPTIVMEQFMSPIISPSSKASKKSPLITQWVDKKHTSTPVRSPGGRPILQEWQIRPAKDEIEIAQTIPGLYMVMDEETPPEDLIYSPPNVIEVPEYLEKARLQELALWGQEPLPTPPRVRKRRKRLAAKRAAEEEIIARELAAREEAMATERAKRTPIRYDDISDSELAELEMEVFGKVLSPINVPPSAPIHVTHRPIGVVRTPTQLNPVWLIAQTPESATRPYETIPVPEAMRFEPRPTRHAPGETPSSPYGEYDTPGMNAMRRRPRRQPREYVRKRLDFSQEEDDYGAEELEKLQDQYEESQHDILDESPPEMSTGEQLSILGDITDYEHEDFTLYVSPSGHNNAYLVESPFKRLAFTFEDTSPIRTELPDELRDFKWMD